MVLCQNPPVWKQKHMMRRLHAAKTSSTKGSLVLLRQVETTLHVRKAAKVVERLDGISFKSSQQARIDSNEQKMASSVARSSAERSKDSLSRSLEGVCRTASSQEAFQ